MPENRQTTGKRKAPSTAFKKGQTGNPGGRPKRTAEEIDLIAACKTKTPAALAVIERLMTSASSDAVKLNAAMSIIERAYGKATQFVDAKVSTLADLSDEDLDKLIAQKAKEAGIALH